MDNDGPSQQRRNTLVLHHWLSHWQAQFPNANTAGVLHPHHKHMRGMQLVPDTVNNIIQNWRTRKLKMQTDEWKYLLNTNVDLVRELWTWSQPHYHGWDELIQEIIPAASRRHFTRTDALKRSDNGQRTRMVSAMIQKALTWSTGRDAPIVPTDGRRGPGLAPREAFRGTSRDSCSPSGNAFGAQTGNQTFKSPVPESWSSPDSQETVANQPATAPKPTFGDSEPSDAPSTSVSAIQILMLCRHLMDFGYKDSPSLTLLDAARRGCGDLEAALDLLERDQATATAGEQQQPQPQPANLTGLYSPSQCGQQGRQVPDGFDGLLKMHRQIGRQSQAAQDVVGRGAGPKDFKERRQRDLRRYAEQQQVQDVVDFMKCLSSDDEEAAEVTDKALMKELRKREQLRSKTRLRQNEQKINKKLAKEKTKDKEGKRAREGNQQPEKQPQKKKKLQKGKPMVIESDIEDEIDENDLRHELDDAVDDELEPGEDGSLSDKANFVVQRIKAHRWIKGRLELYIMWEESAEQTWEPVANLDACGDILIEYKENNGMSENDPFVDSLLVINSEHLPMVANGQEYEGYVQEKCLTMFEGQPVLYEVYFRDDDKSHKVELGKLEEGPDYHSIQTL